MVTEIEPHNGQDSRQLPVPILEPAAFAKAVGLTERTVTNMLSRGAIPSIKIGKRRMVNLIKLVDECKKEA